MKFRYILARTEKFVTDNSPLILTTFAVAGTISTAVLTGKASFRAAEILAEAKKEVEFYETRRDYLTNKETVELIWKLYVPAVGTGVMTVSCIVMANRIGVRRAAAMAAAYSISEKAFDDYREKMIEKLGLGQEQKARDEIAQAGVDANPPGQNMIYVTQGEGLLCKDARSGRYWPCDMETIKKAQNDTNHAIINHGYASLTEFYNRVGLENTKESDDVGWNSDKLLEIYFSTTISDNQKPVLVMDFSVEPVRNFFRTH